MTSLEENVSGIMDFINAHVHTTIITPQLNAFEIIGRKILEQYSEAEIGVISKTRDVSRTHVGNLNSERVYAYGSFEQGFRMFLEGNIKCSVLFFTDCSYSVESKKHLFMFVRAYQIQMLIGEKLPRLVFLFKNANHKSDKEHVLYFAPETQLTVFFQPKFDGPEDRNTMLNKISQIGKSYLSKEEEKICVIVPYSGYFQNSEVLERDILSNKQYAFLTEEEAYLLAENEHDVIPSSGRFGNFVAIIDTCMRRIAFSSLGGGIRFMDGIVGSNYLEDIESIPRTFQEQFGKTLPIYRMIDMKTYKNLRVYAKPYVTQYAKLFKSQEIPFSEIIPNPEPIYYDVEKFVSLASIQSENEKPWDRTQEIVGPLANAFIDKWKEMFGMEMTPLLFAAAFDCLNFDFLEYENDFETPEFDRQDCFKLQFFKEHFESFRGIDSVEVFSNVWNTYVEENSEFSDWIFEHYLQFDRMMEFFNTFTSLVNSHMKNSMGKKVKITRESINRCRKILALLRENEACKISEERVSVYSLSYKSLEKSEQNNGLLGAEGKEIKIVKTLLFKPIDPDKTVFPILYDQNGYVHSFILANDE